MPSDNSRTTPSAQWIRDTVNELVQKGYDPAPVYQGGKTAPYAGGQSYSNPDESCWIDALAVAAILGDTILVDRDGYKENQGCPLAPSSDELARIIGLDRLPSAVQQNVAGDSQHFLFRLPNDATASELKCSDDGRCIPGVDIKTGNQVVFFKPGKIVSLPYKSELPEAPKALIEILSKPSRRAKAGTKANAQDWTLLSEKPSYLLTTKVDNSNLTVGVSFDQTPENTSRVIAALRQVDPDVGRSEWMKVIWSLASLFHVEGWDLDWVVELANRWSSEAPARYKTNGREAIEQLVNDYDPAHTDRITINTLLHQADASDDIDLVGLVAEGAANTNRFSLANGRLTVSLEPPQPRNWLLQDVLLQGKVSLLAGFGGTSKSQFAIQLAIAIALGKSSCGKPTAFGKSLLFFAEEDKSEISRRVNAYARANGLDNDAISAIKDNVFGFGLAGQDVRLNTKQGSELRPTNVADQVVKAATAAEDVKLIVLDHVGLFHGGDFNAREDVAYTMRQATDIAERTQAAVMLLAHSPKGSAKDEESDWTQVFGSTAFVDQARSVIILSVMKVGEAKKYGISDEERKSYVSATLVKSNYSPIDYQHWFKRLSHDGVGLLLDTVLTKPKPPITKSLQVKIIDLIEANPGKFTKNLFKERYSGKKNDPLKASWPEIARTIDEMLDEGILERRSASEAERKKWGHRSSTPILVVISNE